MKKIFFLFAIINYQLSIINSAFGQANTYFHDRIDTTLFAVADTVGHGANNYYATNLFSDFNIKKYLNGTTVNLFIKKGVTATATLTLITKSGTLPTKTIKKANGQNLVIGDIVDSSNVILTFYGNSWRLSGTHTSTTAWSLTGNSGTIDGTNFIGTTDNVPFNIKVNNQKAGRIDSSNYNTFLGVYSGLTNTSGSFNTSIGFNSLRNNSVGSQNCAFGHLALANNIVDGNTAMGVSALQLNTTGFSNVGIGSSALFFNTTGIKNTAIGVAALQLNVGDNNTAVGYASMGSNTSGTNNTSIGYLADVSSPSLINATAIGANAIAGANNALVLGNAASVGIGISSPTAKLHVVGDGSTAATFTAKFQNNSNELLLGLRDDAVIQAGKESNFSLYIGNNGIANSLTTAIQNTIIGSNSFTDNTTGSYNVAMGTLAMWHNVDGSRNTAIGYGALYNQTTGDNNVAIGTSALSNNNGGSYLVAIGFHPLFSNTTGYSNIALGDETMSINTTGYRNVAIGGECMTGNTIGVANSIVGSFGMDSNSVGSGNSGIGYQVIFNNKSDFNSSLGYRSGFTNNNGGYNSFFGNYAGYYQQNITGRSYFGNYDYINSVHENNTTPIIIYGMSQDSSKDTIRINGLPFIPNGTQGFSKILSSNSDGLGTWKINNSWIGTATTYTTTGTFTITPSELAGGLLVAATTTVATTMTLPTASDIATQLGATKGFVYDFVVDNTDGSGSGVVTIAVNTGITVSTYPTLADANELVVGVGTTSKFELVFQSPTVCIIKRIS